ncbi:preprotein translocase subunit SecY [Termitidicoccus mucosus]|uniref:Protein translocase subunit SecY n=1 Tax=Termitidicoccus mucosus TaxID=1184151 RepID=A0A178ILF5_9BACT|nr:preprotein translocase subunit SecY [Opitutaceae bacterium TSB47]
MFSAFTNSLKIPELRSRIFYTLGLLFVARVGAHIPIPGLNPQPLQDFFAQQTAAGASSAAGSMVGLYNMFTGGALVKGAVCALGIMPYISASIIFQLMAAVVPSLARLQQEGDVGRQKITQYTRYATVLICVVQAVLLIFTLRNPASLFPGYDHGPIIIISSTWFLITGVVFITAGTLLLMWLGEQITQRGIGNGVSLLITVGILADIPGAAVATYHLFFAPIGVAKLGPLHAVLMVGLFVLVTMGIVMVVQGQRKIPVQYAKRVVGNKVMGGQSSFLPLKVNYSGVMPVIFASAILMFPQQIFSWLGATMQWPWMVEFAHNLLRGNWIYYGIMSFLILFFSYFWVSVMFKPIQIADDLKKYGGYVPGVRPGEPTAKFLDFIMTRLTLAGAIFLTIIAVMPDVLLFEFNVPQRVAIFFGGTGMLITVGVVLDTMRQVETFLLQRHYDGFLKKGRIRARNPGAASAVGEAADMKTVGKLWLVLGAIFLVGILAWLKNTYF